MKNTLIILLTLLVCYFAVISFQQEKEITRLSRFEQPGKKALEDQNKKRVSEKQHWEHVGIHEYAKAWKERHYNKQDSTQKLRR